MGGILIPSPLLYLPFTTIAFYFILSEHFFAADYQNIKFKMKMIKTLFLGNLWYSPRAWTCNGHHTNSGITEKFFTAFELQIFWNYFLFLITFPWRRVKFMYHYMKAKCVIVFVFLFVVSYLSVFFVSEILVILSCNTQFCSSWADSQNIIISF